MSARLLPFLKLLLVCCSLIINYSNVNAQDLSWAKNLNGTGYDAAKCSVVDSAGNTYVAGIFTDVTDFDPGAGVVNLVSSGWDMFLLKLDTAGGFLWVKHFVPSSSDIYTEPSDIAIDNLGNLYVTGNFASFGTPGTIDFDPGIGINTLTTTGEMYTTDVFVLKLTNSGAFNWVKQFGGNKGDLSTAIALDHSGNIFTTGSFKGTADFDPSTGIENITSTSTYGNAFVSKLDNNGNFVWVKKMGGLEFIKSKTLKVDGTGNIYTMGTFSGTVDFDPGTGIENLVTGMGPYGWSNANIFICKWDGNGAYVWAKNLGIPNNIYSGDVSPMAMAIDISGNVITTGGFTDTTDFDPGVDTVYLISSLTGVADVDVFVTKLNSNGALVWAKSMGGVNGELAFGLTTDANGNIYTVGTYAGPGDFDPSDTAIYLMTPPSQAGALFISKLDSSGIFKWAKSIGGQQCGLGLNGIDISVNSVDNAIHIASEFTCTVDFDPGPDTFNLDASTNNVFIVKLKNCEPVSSTIAISACDSYTFNGIVYNQSGLYPHEFITASNCDSFVTLSLTITPKPISTVTQNNNLLTANTTGATYQWIDCNNGNDNIAGANGQAYSAPSNGSYAVVISKDGCSDTSICYQVTTVSIKDKAEVVFNIYPNPVKDNFSIVTGTLIKNGSFRLTNLLGQVVMERDGLHGSKFLIDLSGFASGIYLLQLKVATTTYSFKIVKE